MKKTIAAFLLTLVLAVTMASQASAIASPEATIPTGITTAQGFVDALRALTDWLFVILVVISVIFIVLAGLQFITGGGDPTAVSAARTKLICSGWYRCCVACARTSTCDRQSYPRITCSKITYPHTNRAPRRWRIYVKLCTI